MAKKKTNVAPAEEAKTVQTVEATKTEVPAADAPAEGAEATDTPAEEQPKEEQPKEASKPVFDAPLIDIIKIQQFKRNNPRLYKLLIDEFKATNGQ